jgi:predicted nucleic acid-binding protein
LIILDTDIVSSAIAIANRAILISRNLIDFRQVPDLQVEDWTKVA